MSNAELHTEVVAYIEGRLFKVEFGWQRSHPAVIVMRAGGKAWELSRTVLWAATHEPCIGAWVGGGDVSACSLGRTLRLALYPSRNRPTVFLDLPAVPVTDFLDHTERLCPSHGIEEEILIGAEIDRALTEILG